ncbi:hypothetical protein GQR58_023428 [Nymphon striatum]|nr:hypothetical protein GQR58_023428 [Nymphon striatum]
MKQVRFCFSQPIFILQEYIQFKETGFLRVKFDSSVIFIAGQIRLVMPDIKQHALLSVDYKIKYLNSKEDVIAKDHQYITANYTIKHHYADQFDGNVPLKNRWNRWNRKNRWKNRWNDRRGQVKHILKCFHSSDIAVLTENLRYKRQNLRLVRYHVIIIRIRGPTHVQSSILSRNAYINTQSGDLIKNPEISEKSGEMVGLILRVSLAVFEMLQDLFSQDV